MASNVLSPDQGGWKFWAGCGSSEPRLQPPGSCGLSWPAAPGPRPSPAVLGPQRVLSQDTLRDLFACRPDSSDCVLFIFFSYPSVLFTLLLFWSVSLRSPLRFFFLFRRFSSSFPLSCSHFPFHYPRSPFQLRFSFSLFLSSLPGARLPSPPGAAPADQEGLPGTPFLPPPARGGSPPLPPRVPSERRAVPPPPCRCHVPAGPRGARSRPRRLKCGAEGRGGQLRGGGSGAGGSGGGGTGHTRPSGPTAALRLSAAGAPGAPSRPPPPLPSGMF